MEYFTKWFEAYAIPNKVAKAIVQVLIRKFVSRIGVDSDRGRNFQRELFRSKYEKLGIPKTRTTGLHP